MIVDKNKERRQSHRSARPAGMVFTSRKKVKKEKDKKLAETIKNMERNG